MVVECGFAIYLEQCIQINKLLSIYVAGLKMSCFDATHQLFLVYAI